jgi:type IV secretory pathway protease TraF
MKKLSWKSAAMLVAGFAITSMVLKGLPWSLSVNVTPSIPLGFYMLHETGPNATYELGTLVSFSYTSPDWAANRLNYPITGANFMKYIGAMPGEHLFTEAGAVYACRSAHLDVELCRPLGSLRAADSKGQPLPQNIWKGEQIPGDQLFMTATRVADSYDSRQYGLVHKAAIRGKLVPIFTW